MVVDTILFCHTKKYKYAGEGHICLVPKKRADLKMIHDENNLLLDDELVVVRSQLKKSKHACLYVRNDACLYVRNEHLRGFFVK